jgi:hypothetical protein
LLVYGFCAVAAAFSLLQDTLKNQFSGLVIILFCAATWICIRHLAEEHPRASVFHTIAWLEALRQTYGYQPVVYTTSAPGNGLRNGIVSHTSRTPDSSAFSIPVKLRPSFLYI